jgi:hypothetical protein
MIKLLLEKKKDISFFLANEGLNTCIPKGEPIK